MVRLCFGTQDQINDKIHDDLSFGNAIRFSYRSMQIATNNFSRNRIIGEGGSSKVYRGVLPNGTLIAVKKYKDGNESYYSSSVQKFLRMVKVMSCIRHPNINQVMGYCIHKNSWLLVSEYVDNGNLFHLIHNQQKRSESVFNWPMRVAICFGIARGLSHLHENANPRVVHRDIKPSNILLDTNFTPKITDFDLVKFYGDSNELPLEAAMATTLDDFDPDSGLTTCIKGTCGYLDPEYLESSRITPKSDVYSFGVTMLEIISGRKAVFLSNIDSNDTNIIFIVRWALNCFRNERVLEIIDPVLTDFPTDDVQHFIDVALLCIKEESKKRPSMREVMQMLDGACNSFRRQLPLSYSPHYFSAASSFRSSIAQTEDACEGEAESADSDTELQAQPEIEGAETSAAQSNVATVSQALVQQQQHQLGIVLSGTGDLVERLSQTMVFKKSTKLDFPEAVYPPFRTRVFQRGGSRNLYTF